MTYEVAVAGVGIHPFGRYDDKSLADLAAVALEQAFAQAGMEFGDVGTVFLGNALGPTGVAAALAEALGIDGIPVVRIEQACASGSSALRLACEVVSSGACDTAIALGVEKMGKGLLQFDDGKSYQARLSLDLFPLLYSLKSRQYIECGASSTAGIASIAVKARSLGAKTAHAATDREVSVEEVLASPMIADPITRLQCCRNVDGAAAAVVTRAKVGDGLPRVRGWVGGNEIDDPNRPMIHGLDARERIVKILSERLYEAAGVGPDDIDIIQLNDAFAIAEPLYLEALGFASDGDGMALYHDGHTGMSGRHTVNSDGGMIGRGHSLGATGLAMVYEIVTQLRGLAGGRQLPRRRMGLVQSHGYGAENLFIISC